MKRSLFLIFALPLFFACNNNTPDNPSQGDKTSANVTYKDMTIHVLSEEIKKEAPYIRLIGEYDNWTILDIMHDGLNNDSSRSFVFLNNSEQVGYYCYATEKMVLMSQFTNDPMDGLRTGNVLLTSTDDQYTYVRVVKDILGSYEILSEKAIPNETLTQKTPTSRDDYFDGFGKSIYQTISKHFRAGAEEISDNTGVLAWLPDNVGGAGNLLGNIWSTFVFNVSLHQIYDCNPELEEVLHEDIEQDKNFFIKMGLYSNKYLALAGYAYNAITKGTEMGKMWLSSGQIGQVVEEEDYGTVDYPIYTLSRAINSNRNVQVIATLPPAYIVTHSVSQVSETTADIYVSVTATGSSMSYISSMGLVYTNYISGEKKEVELSSLNQSVSLSGLTPCTTYLCYAYVNSMGQTYKSPAAFFNTEGELQLIPSSLSFSTEGGTEIVSLSLYSEYISSLNVTGPEWCRLSYNSPAAAFVVTAQPTDKERNGMIRVTVRLTSGETKTAQLPISQTANTWDNTNWKFGGDLTTSGFGESSTGYLELYLKINSLANNDYTISSGGQTLACTLSEDSKDHLTGNFSYTYDGYTAVWHLSITRTSKTTATCDINCSTGAVSQHGTLYGTLIE